MSKLALLVQHVQAFDFFFLLSFKDLPSVITRL